MVRTSVEITHALEQAGWTCFGDMAPAPTPLCKQHYHIVYDALQPRQCVTCGARLRGGNHRSCPQPDIIQKHLSENIGFEGDIQAGDQVCLVCYKSHLVSLRDNIPISTDTDLAELLREQAHSIPTEVITQDVIDVAIKITILSVGNILLEKHAVLLPTIHSIFVGHVTDMSEGGNVNIEGVKSVSSRCILSHLTASLEHHITYSCKVQKYGTLVYRPNTDLVPLLSEALWKLCKLKSNQDEKTQIASNITPTTSFTDSLINLNQLIQSQISAFLAKDSASPFDHDEIDFNELIQQIEWTMETMESHKYTYQVKI